MINESVISASIISSISGNSETDSTKAIKLYADDLAKIISDAIKSSTIVVPAAIPVQVTPSTGTGVTTSIVKASIS